MTNVGETPTEKRVTLKEALRLAAEKSAKPLIGRLPTTEKQPHWRTRTKNISLVPDSIPEPTRTERDISFIVDCLRGRKDIKGYHSPGCNASNCSDFHRCQEMSRMLSIKGRGNTYDTEIHHY